MRRYWLVTAWLLAFMLLLFGVAEWLQPPLLTSPEPWLDGGGPAAAAIGVGLLVADILLPVPSSVIMLAHGRFFGPLLGTLLSLLGSLGLAATGFAVGRAGGPLFERLVPPAERGRADHLLRQWGSLAILVTRPVPLLAETVAIMAGTSPLSFGQVMLAAALGALPSSCLLAMAGAYTQSLQSSLLAFLVVLLVAGLFWLIGVRAGKRDV